MTYRVFLLLLCAVSAAAQTPYGQITGLVTDSTQARVPGASVRAVNLATSVATSNVSNAEGDYLLQALIPGRYRVETEATGFKRYVREPIELRAGDVLSLEISLEVGSAAETITVKDESPLLETASASIGQVVDSQRVHGMAVPTSNVYYLMYLMPGVTPGTVGLPTYVWDSGGSPPANMAMAGGRPASNQFTMDGGVIMMSGNGGDFMPPREMVQELRVQTSNYDASAGRFSGGQVSVVLKSGTNAFHGDVVYGHLTRGLMTRDFFTNRFIYSTSTGPITKAKIDNAFPPQRRIDKRFNISGPLYLPKIYNGKNRTFWTYGLTFFKRQASSLGVYTVPTQKERQGDFSDLLALGSQYQIYDPLTTTIANGRITRSPFPNNVIPTSRLNPLSLKLLGYYPLPNSPGTADGINNFVAAYPTEAPYQSHVVRIDHMFSDANRLHVTTTYAIPNANGYFPLNPDVFGRRLHRKVYSVAAEDTHIVTPRLMFSARYSMNRQAWTDQSANHGTDLTALGFPASLTAGVDPQMVTFPDITITGYTGIGNSSTGSVAGSGNVRYSTWHWMGGDGTHIRGTHQMRFGTEVRLYNENGFVPQNASPAMAFANTWTLGPLSTSAAAPIGQGMASFLLGLPTSGGVDRNVSYANSSRYHAFYFQDDWKIIPGLTVNLGLRYEVDLPMKERFNRAIGGFDPNASLSIAAAAKAAYALSPIPQVPASQFSVSGGLLFAGVNGVPSRLWKTSNNFSPRIGVAWQFSRNMVLRGGYGMFYEPIGADNQSVNQLGFSRRTALVASPDNGLTFTANIQNPFPNGFLAPLGAALGPDVSDGQSVTYFSPKLHEGFCQRWSVDLQREFPGRVLLDVGYVGTRGSDLPVGKQYNPVPRQYYSTSPVRDQAAIDFLGGVVANPFAGLAAVSGTSLQGTTIARSQLLRPMPQLTSVVASENVGASWYNALQMRIEKRFSHGFTLQASYTWSKNIEAMSYLNDTDPDRHRVVSSFDRPHQLTVSGIYELPFGLKRRWLSSNRWLDYVVGGWNVNAMYQAASGLPLTFGNVLFNGNIKDIPLPASERTVDRWFNVNAGFVTNANLQLASNIRTFPLSLNSVRSGGVNIWNISIHKNLRITEKVRMELRAEAVDAFNHPIFAAPNTTPTSTAFGQVTSVLGGTQRIITLFAKLSW